MQYTATVRLFANGRVTIPEVIRKALDLKDRDLIKIIVERIEVTDSKKK